MGTEQVQKFSLKGLLSDEVIEERLGVAAFLADLSELWNEMGEGSNLEVTISIRGTARGTSALSIAGKLDHVREEFSALCAAPVAHSFVARRVRCAKEGA